MTKDDVREKIVGIMSKLYKKDPAEIKDENDIAKDFGAKSQDMVQLTALVQKELGIKVSYIQSRKAKTVGDWVETATTLVESKR